MLAIPHCFVFFVPDFFVMLRATGPPAAGLATFPAIFWRPITVYVDNFRTNESINLLPSHGIAETCTILAMAPLVENLWDRIQSHQQLC